jgi:hypothetical protein
LCMISLQSGAPAKISRNVIDNAHTSVLSLHNSPNLKHLQNLNHTQWPNCVQHFWIVWSTALCLCEWHCNGQAWINLCLCIASSTCAFLGYAYNWICICHSSTVTNTQWHTHTRVLRHFIRKSKQTNMTLSNINLSDNSVNDLRPREPFLWMLGVMNCSGDA